VSLRRNIDWRLGVAVLFLIFSGTLAGRSFWKAVALDPLPGNAKRDDRQDIGPIERLLAPSGEIMVTTVINDPFHPERKAAAGRFRPEVSDPEGPPVSAAQARPETIRLLGTVVLDNGGFAMVEHQGEARMIRAGESFGGYRLRKIERGQAVFTSASGERKVLDVEKEDG
jgi:hypothetical protein